MLPLFWANYCMQMSMNLIFRIFHEKQQIFEVTSYLVISVLGIPWVSL